jgi:hypothetical protein
MILIGLWCVTLTLSVNAQEKNDHVLIKDGDPVSGMSAQQEKRPAVTSRLQLGEDVAATRAPLITESTLNDETFDSWRAGDAFRDPESKAAADSIKVIELPPRIEDKKP